MAILYQFIEVMLVISYLITCFLYGRLFFSEQQQKPKYLQGSLILSLGLHAGLLIMISGINQRCPLTTSGEALLFCSLLVASAHFCSELFSRNKQLGIFTLLPTAISVLIAAFMISYKPDVAPSNQMTLLFAFHIVFSLASFACYTIGSIMASMYVILFRKLKTKQFDTVFKKLPNLENLETIITIWILLGTLMMAIASVVGHFWVVRELSNKGMTLSEWSIFSVVLLFTGALWFRKFNGLSGIRFSCTILGAFILLVLSQVYGVHGF